MFGLDRNFICGRRRGDEVWRRARFPLRSRARPAAFYPRQSSQISTDYGFIIWNIRGPRILLGIIVGASLSVAGTSFQALLRNPLADPYVLGVSSGASVGAVLALIATPFLSLSPSLSALLTPLGAFSWCRRDDRRRLLSRPSRWTDRQHYPPSRRCYHRSFLSAIITFLMGTVSTGNLVAWFSG